MKKILIIDDEEDMCWALEKPLSQDGYIVVTSTSGSEGMDIFNNVSFDLVLLDIKIKECNGLVLLEKIRAKNSQVPVLIMTGYSSISLALDAIDKGATGYLTKPVKVVNLREMVRELLLGESAENSGLCNKRHN